MMKKVFAYIFVLISSLGLSSCIDDDNNYNYSEEIKLKGEGITGMKSEYSLAYGQELTITPSFEFVSKNDIDNLSYEWRLDDKLLLDETGPSSTFSFDRGGVHEVTFSVVHNKTGVKFSYTSLIRVRSPFARGWLVLSEGQNQESVLNFVGASTIIYKMTVSDGDKSAVIDRDSLDYNLLFENVSEGLGYQPKGLFLNVGYLGPYGELYENSDEVGVMQDRWVELNGNTLERVVYTEDEFRGDLPESGFKPLAATMTYSAKALLNADQHIYWAAMSYASDFHSCAYANFPLEENRKFKGLFPSYRLNKHHGVMPAISSDNELVGIIDDAETVYGGGAELEISKYSSSVCNVRDGEYTDSPIDERYNLGSAEVLSILPATTTDEGYQDVKPAWVALMKDGSRYEIMFFQWKIGSYEWSNRLKSLDYEKHVLDGLNAVSDMAVFNVKKYVILAQGNDLWYLQYGVDNQGTLKKIHSFSSPIKALAANDINVTYSGTPQKWQPNHNGQLGVALEDGTFSIFEVWEIKDEQKITTDVRVNQVFPDPKSSKPLKNHFGKIVDVLYKYGSIREFVKFQY